MCIKIYTYIKICARISSTTDYAFRIHMCITWSRNERERWERKRHKKNKRLCESVGERKLMRKVETERKIKGRRKR